MPNIDMSKHFVQFAFEAGTYYQVHGEPSESPAAFEDAMQEAKRVALMSGEKFDRDAAGRAWFKGRQRG